MIAPNVVRVTLSKILAEYRMLPAKAVMHPDQSAMFDMFAIVEGVEVIKGDALEGLELLGRAFRKTMAGIPVVEDIREPNDRIQFKNADDVVVGEIVHLAIPVAYEG